MVVAWSGLAYAIAKPSPGGLPRRVQMPNTWDVTTTWTVAGVRTAELPGQPHAVAETQSLRPAGLALRRAVLKRLPDLACGANGGAAGDMLLKQLGCSGI